MEVDVGNDRQMDEDHMLGCLHCGGRFPAKQLVADGIGEGKQGCPFCGAGGIGIDIFDADSPMLK